MLLVPAVAEVDEKTAIGAVEARNAAAVFLAVWQFKLNISIRARAGSDLGGGGELSHESKIADSRRNATKKIIFYFYFSCVFFFTSHNPLIFKQLRSAAGARPVTRSFSTTYSVFGLTTPTTTEGVVFSPIHKNHSESARLIHAAHVSARHTQKIVKF